MTAKKKKLIRVKYRNGRDAESQSYGYAGIHYAFVSRSDGDYIQSTEIMTCREYVNRAVWASANDKPAGTDFSSKTDIHIDFTKLRLLIVHDPEHYDEFKKKLFNGKTALNVLEKVNEWAPSVITTVKHSKYKNAWLLTGPPEWQAHPQMLSIATWILRIAVKYGPLKTDNFDTLEANLYRMIDRNHSALDISTFLPEFWDKLYIILKYYNDIFSDIDEYKAWKDVRSEDFGVNSGFYNFTNNSVVYSKQITAAQQKFFKLCKKHLPRKN